MAANSRVAKIQSLARADAILGAIATMPQARARLSEIAERLSLHKNTVFSLLETLCALGYVRQLPRSKDYVLGHRVFELARVSEARLDIAHMARPLMLRTVTAVNESTSLAVPGPSDVLIISTIEGTHGVRGARYQGRHSPYHASAVGKAMLAFMTASDRDAILGADDLPRLTAKTIKSRAALLRQLADVHKRGFAVSLEEEEIGANAVSAPILGAMGEVVGAIAVWGPTPRLPPDRLAKIGTALARECRGLVERGDY